MKKSILNGIMGGWKTEQFYLIYVNAFVLCQALVAAVKIIR